MGNPTNTEELDEFGFPLSGYITEELDEFGFPLSGYETESLHEEYIKPTVDKIKDVSGYKEFVDKEVDETKPEELDEFGFPLSGYDTPIPKDIELPPEDVAKLPQSKLEVYNQYLKDNAEGITNPLTGETNQFKKFKPLTEAEQESKKQYKIRKKKERAIEYKEKKEYNEAGGYGWFDRTGEALSSGIDELMNTGDGIELGIADFKTDEGPKEKINQEEVGKLVAQRKLQNKLEEISKNKAKPINGFDVMAAFEQEGFREGISNIPEWLATLAAESGPRMAVPIVLGLGAAAAVPIAGIGLATMVGSYGLLTFADFMLTQADYAEKTEDINSGRALKWTVPATIAGLFTDRFVLGIGKFGKPAIKKAMIEAGIKNAGGEAVKKGVLSTAGQYTKRGAQGFVAGVIAEGGSEAFETYAELTQAGIDINSEEAQDMIFLAFISGGALGGSIKLATNLRREYKITKEKLAKIKDDINKPEEKDSKEIKKARWDELLASGDTQALNQAIDDLESSAPKVITEETLKNLKINPRSLLYKNLLGQKTTTKSGKIRIKEALDNAGDTKIDETAANALLKLIDEPALQEKPSSKGEPQFAKQKPQRIDDTPIGESLEIFEPVANTDITDTARIETSGRTPVGDSTGDTRRTGNRTVGVNNTLGGLPPPDLPPPSISKYPLPDNFPTSKLPESSINYRKEIELYKDLTNIDNRLETAIGNYENQIAQDRRVKGKPSPAYLRPIKQIQTERNQKIKEIIDNANVKPSAPSAPPEFNPALLPPEQQELFAKQKEVEKTQITSTTPETLIESWKNKWGNNVELAMKRGIANVVPTFDALPPEVNKTNIPPNAKAFIVNGKAYFIADRIKASEGPNMLLHEIGVHYGLKGMLGKANYDRVVKSLNNKKDSDKDIKAAFKEVAIFYPELDKNSDRFIQEVIAQIGDNSPNNSIFRQVVVYIKNFLSKLGMGWNVDNISAAEIQVMIQESLRVALAPESSPDVTSETFALASKDPNVPAQPFYSPLRKFMDGIKMTNMPAKQWISYFEKNSGKGVKEELQVTGVFDYLNLREDLRTNPELDDALITNRERQSEMAPIINAKRLATRNENVTKDDILEMMEINNTMVKTLGSSTTVEYTKAELDNIEGEYRNNYWEKQNTTREEAIKNAAKSLIGNKFVQIRNLSELKSMRADLIDEVGENIANEMRIENSGASSIFDIILIEGIYEVYSQEQGLIKVYINEKFLDKNKIEEYSTMKNSVKGFNDYINNLKDKGIPIEYYDPIAPQSLTEGVPSLEGFSEFINAIEDYVPANLLNSTMKKLQNVYNKPFYTPQLEKESTLKVEERVDLDVDKHLNEMIEKKKEGTGTWGNAQFLLGDWTDMGELVIKLAENAPKSFTPAFISEHWADIKNALLHIRYNIRQDSDGNRVLFIEELQSDWGTSIKSPLRNAQARLKTTLDDIRALKLNLIFGYNPQIKNADFTPGQRNSDLQSLEAQKRSQEKEVERQQDILKNSRYTIPFVESTDLWTKIGIKAIIRQAAELNVDKVAFLNATQAQTQHNYSEFTTRAQVDRIRRGDSKKEIEQGIKNAKAYYDVIVPTQLKKVLKELKGPQIEEISFTQQNALPQPYFLSEKFDGIRSTTNANISANLLLAKKQRKEIIKKMKALVKDKTVYTFDEYEHTPNVPIDKDSVVESYLKNTPGAKRVTRNREEAGNQYDDVFELYKISMQDAINESYDEDLNPNIKKTLIDNGLLRDEVDMAFFSNKGEGGYTNPVDNFELKRLFANTREMYQPAAIYPTMKVIKNKELLDTIEKEMDQNVVDLENFQDLFIELQLNNTKITNITNRFPSLQPTEEYAKRWPSEQLGFTMTPELKEKALAGQPMFAKQRPNPKKMKENLKKTGYDSKKAKLEDDKNVFNIPVLDKFQTEVFNWDTAFNNFLQRAMINQKKLTWDEISKKLLDISVSQAVHLDTIANVFLEKGKLIWEEGTSKFKGISREVPSFVELQKLLKKSLPSNMTMEEYENMASQALIAKRETALSPIQKALDKRVKALIAQGKKEEAKKLFDAESIILRMTPAERKAGLEFMNKDSDVYLNGIDEIYDMWLKIRDEVVEFGVAQETLGRNEADKWLDVMDYVPFFTMDQVANGVPRESTKGILAYISNPKFKGSTKRVNNIFENMQRWTTYSVMKGVQNKISINKIDAGMEIMPDLFKRLKGNEKGSDNVITLMRKTDNGNVVPVRYDVADPFFLKAFQGFDSILLPGLNGIMSVASDAADSLRTTVIRNPFFALSQIFLQDPYSAMFSSGTKNGAMVLLRAIKEFPLTLLGWSKAHKELEKYGVVGRASSFTQSAQLKQSSDALLREAAKGKFNIFNVLNRAATGIIEVGGLIPTRVILDRIAMYADNAVRQATYEQEMAESGNKGIALEKGLDVINFRRAGASSGITALRQMSPFFGAYLQALSIQGRVLSGRGISPQKRAEGLKRFLYTAAMATTANLIYNMLISDEEDYKKRDPAQRDWRIYTGKDGIFFRIRPDIFGWITKVLPERFYQNMIAESEDNRKTMDSIIRTLKEATIIGPTPLQMIRPAVEVMINQRVRGGFPIVPQRLEGAPTEEQFTKNTSELMKMLSDQAKKMGIEFSPLKATYLLQQYFSYAANLIFALTDELVSDQYFNVERPEQSEQNKQNRLMPSFVDKEEGNRQEADFYEMKKDFKKIIDEVNYMEKNNWDREKVEKYKKENRTKIIAGGELELIQQQLSDIRKQLQDVRNAPKDRYNAQQKRVKIEQLLKDQGNNLKRIRQMRDDVYGVKMQAPTYDKTLPAN